MYICPNKNSQEWKALVEKVGYDTAWKYFISNNFEVPSLEQIAGISLVNSPNVDKIKKYLVGTNFFAASKEYSSGIRVKNKRVYAEALHLVNRINSQYPGLLSIQTVQNSGTTQINIVRINQGQQKLFNNYYDIPRSNNTKGLLLSGFETFEQQREAIDVMASHVLQVMQEEKIRFKQAIESFYSIVDELQKEEALSVYSTLKENRDALTKQVFSKLANDLKLIANPVLKGTSTESTDTTKDEDEDIDESPEIDETTKTWRDSWVFQYNAKSNALDKVKQFLAFTPRTTYNKDTGEYKIIESIIPGQPVYMPYDEVYEQLKAILAGVPNTWEAMKAELENYSISRPFIPDLIQRIENFEEDAEQLKRQFVSTMSSSYSGFKTILIKEKKTFIPELGDYVENGKYFNIIDTDQSSVEKVILAKWQGTFKRTDFFKTKEGKLVANKEAINTYLKEIEEAKKNPTEENVKALLDKIGITLTDVSLEQLVKGKVGRLGIQEQFGVRAGLFTLIRARLEGKVDADQNDVEDDDDDDELPNNPLVNNSAVRDLARLESRNSEYYFSNTFKDGEGNTVYSYTFNKFLTREFNKLRGDSNYAKSLLNLPFNNLVKIDGKPIFKTWLSYLAEDSKPFKDIFNISPFDTIKLVGKDRDGQKLAGMSSLDLELTRMALIQNSGQRKKGLGEHTDGARVINYLLTVPSKTTSYIIKGIGQEVKLYFQNGNYRLDKGTLDALYAPVVAEYNRILSADKESEKQFFFFPSMNSIIRDKDGKILLPTDKIGEKTVEQLLKEELKKVVYKATQDKIKEWSEVGIINGNKLVHVDVNYENNILKQQSNSEYEQTIYAAVDYVVQSILAKFNTTQTFLDDPATYYSKNIDKTWDNVSKRLTNIIAPAKDGMLDETNNTYLAVRLKDREVAAYNRAQLFARLQDLYKNSKFPYDSITGTDAQEYTTLREELAVSYMYGEISTKYYKKMLERIDKEGDNLVLTPKEIEKFLLARKPVYSNRKVGTKKVTRDYIKSSSIPLIPQLTKGLEIDKLRTAMETLEKKRGLTVRAAFDSATKLTSVSSVADIWTTEGIKENLDLEPHATILDRSNFGIQQEVPYDEDKDEILRSTQVLKLIFDSLNNVEGFEYQGKVYKGSELKELYTEQWKKLYESARQSLEDELTIDGVFNKRKLIKLLEQEGIKRNYSFAQLSYLSPNEDGTDFSLPFWAHTNNDKEQAIITSLWTNRILKQKLPGGSYVLVSEEGFNGRSKDIAYTKEYDPRTGLKPMRIAYKKDRKAIEQEEYDKLSKEEQAQYRKVVKPAQVIMSWNLRSKTGKLLDRSKYIITDSEGNTFLDAKKVPLEILRQFGFRIPNQGHNSQSLIEIVGFLPDSYAGIVIASRNFVTQMGSDFDVDKLYVYNYSLFDDIATGKLERDKDDKRNNILDVYKSVLFNPAVFDKVTKPLDEGNNGKIVEEIKALQTTTKDNYLNPDYDRDKYLQSVDGKIMVGLTSTGNTFNTLLQNKKSYLQKPITTADGNTVYVPAYVYWKNRSGEVLKLTKLWDEETIYGRSKNAIHQAIQSTAVDNEKEPKLDYLNATAETYPVVNLMMKLGLEEADIYLFTAQPILKQYTQLTKQSRSIVRGEYLDADKIYAKLRNQKAADSIKEKVGEDIAIADIAIGEEDLRKALYGEKSDKYKSMFSVAEIQEIVLQKFYRMKSYGEQLNAIQNLFNIESKGIGKSLLDVAERDEKTSNILNQHTFANMNNVLGEVEEGELIPNTISGHAINSALFSASRVLAASDLMPFYNPYFKQFIQEYENYTQKETNADQKYELWKAIKAYNFSKILSPEAKKNIFFDSDTNKSLNTRITELLGTKLKNNPFILRLDLSNVHKDGKLPSLVLYNSAKEADIEETNIYQGLVDLVYNSDRELREIGRDLVYYYFMNGGSSNSKDYGRYIDSNMMEVLNLNDGLKQISFNDPATWGYASQKVSEILVQYFQHNPNLAPSIKDMQLKGAPTFTKTGFDIEQQKLPVGVSTLYPIVHHGSNVYRLTGAPHNAKTGDTTLRYTLLSQKASKFYTDYQFDHTPAALINIKEEPQAPSTPVNPVTESKNAWKNPLLPASYADLVGTNLETALSSINTSEYFKALASAFSRLKGVLGDVKVEAVEDDKPYFGRWDQKTIRVNIKQLANRGKVDRKMIESTILKETIHAVFTKVFHSDGVTPTEEQIAAKDAINTLFQTVRNMVLNEETSLWDKDTLVKYESLVQKYRAQQTTEQEENWMIANKQRYYGLTNVEDFLHEVLLEPEFFKLANILEYDQDKSFLTRIYEAIRDFVNSFIDKAGISVNEQSVLEEALTNLLAITNTEANGNSTTEVQEDLMYDLAAETEKDERNFERIFHDYSSRLSLISKAITAAELENNNEKKVQLIERYKEIKKEQQDLVEANSLETIIEVGKKDLAETDRLLNKDVITEQEFRYADLVLGTWTKINNTDLYAVLTTDDIAKRTEASRQVEELVAQANSLKIRLDADKKEVIQNQIKEVTGKEIDISEITQVKDISSAQATFRDITSSDNVILHVVDKWLRRADYQQVLELSEMIKRLDQLAENLAKNGIAKRDDYARVFGQRTKEGKLTGEIVDALIPEYFATRDKLKNEIELAPNPAERHDRAKEYYDWIKDNHIFVDYIKMYNRDINGYLVERTDNNYLEEFKKEAGKDYDKLIDNARNLVAEYNEELRLQHLVFEGHAERTKKLDIWQLENSPIIYLENLQNGLKVRQVDGEVIKNQGWRYVSKRAIAEWEDAQYNEIHAEGNEHLAEYYAFWRTTLKQMQNYLPYHIRIELKATDIPAIEKTLIDELQDSGISKYANRLWSSLLDEISVSKNEIQRTIDPITGNFTKEFKFSYIGEINPEDKSYDLNKVLKLFAAQAIGYKYKAQIEDKVRLAESVLKSALERQIRTDGKPMTDRFGRTTTAKGLVNLYNQLDYVIDTFYGNKRDTLEGKTNTEYMTPRDKERFERDVEALGDMSDERKAVEVEKLRNKYTKNFSFSRLGDTLLQYVQLKGMGWNVFAGFNNIIFGQVANFNWSVTGKDFSDDDMLKAMHLMLKDSISKNKKIEALMVRFNTVKQLRDKIYSATTNYNKARKGLEKLLPYELYAKGEYFVQGQVMLAMLNHEKVEVTENGEKKTIPLLEAFNENGEWDSTRFGENAEWEKLGEKSLNFKNKLDALLKKIHGNYDPNSAMLINKKFLGRALIQFRRWIPEGIAQRFDGLKWDEYLQRNTEGRYRTFYSLGLKKSLRTLFRMVLRRGDAAFDGLTDDKEQLELIKENMKKNLREIYFKLSMMAMFTILSGLDDDDEWSRAGKNYTLNTILRLQDDIEFYVSPIAADNIVRTPLPVFNLISDFYKLGDAFVETVEGNGKYKGGVHSGDSKLFWKAVRILPAGASAAALLSKTEGVESFRK